MRKLPPLNALRAFEAVARLGSAQKASKELHVTHGAVSRHVKQLEHWLGITLFDRSQRNLKLNTNGNNYIQTISAALDLIHEGTNNIQNVKTSNMLGIATTHSFASKWLTEQLSNFYKQYSDVEVWLSLDQQQINFNHTNIDIAIRMGKGPWPEYHCIPLMQDKLITVCSPLLLKQSIKLDSPKDLAKHTLLHDQDPNICWNLWFKENNVLNINPSKGPRFSSADILLRAAMSGQGIALVSEKLAAQDINEGRLIQPFSGAVNLGNYHWLVIAKNKLENINVKKFLIWIDNLTYK
ncbi:hypothetical protein CJF42_15225 [Pseudoalteromonas sp. NBT06-2]|uniref:transcriptional regulator GcvA n=1 Tax=Pseudoalteromonas sp. NBT06-2 TaxID=2025950 RepID=UPI000BA6F50D|nr:transcriptional regulator GcvA [Pseudoalteromonas sp. NBT06-2]PAJ73546.1 hypothetical protein CJF42_15225 [Pseudoalteromonas sp. NBT06-2]